MITLDKNAALLYFYGMPYCENIIKLEQIRGHKYMFTTNRGFTVITYLDMVMITVIKDQYAIRKRISRK